jgi:hypothetical protein
MDLLLDLLLGAGLAAAIGIRPFLPVLLVGALASANVLIDFSGTDFVFLEQWPFLLAVLVLVMALDVADRRRGAGSVTGPIAYALIAVAVVLGALEAAGALADDGEPIVPGIVVGAACAALGAVAARQLLARVRRRLDPQAAGALPVYAEAVALLAAGLALLLPPTSVIIVGGLVWLLLGGRRREQEKYAGLRILR